MFSRTLSLLLLLSIIGAFSCIGIVAVQADQFEPTDPPDWFYTDDGFTLSLAYWFNQIFDFPPSSMEPDSIWVLPDYFDWWTPTFEWNGDFQWLSTWAGRDNVWFLPEGVIGNLWITFPNGYVPTNVKFFFIQFEVYKAPGDFGDADILAPPGSDVTIDGFACGDLSDEWTRCTIWGTIKPQPSEETLFLTFNAEFSPVAIDLIYFGTHCEGNPVPAMPSSWGRIKTLFQ